MNIEDLRKKLISAVQFEQKGDWTAAEAICRELLDENPAQLQALVLMGRMSRLQGALDEAAGFLKTAYGLAPDFPQILSELGYLALTQDDFGVAIEKFKRLTEIRPQLADAQFNLGHAFEKTGEYANALVHYRQALSLNITRPAELHARIGSVLTFKGSEEEAKSEFDRALQIESENTPAIFGLGLIQMAYGDFAEARQKFRPAMELDPDFVEVYQQLADSKKFANEDDPDLVTMNRILEDPDRPEYSREKLHYALGKANNDLKQYSAAFAHFNEANILKRKRVRHYDPNGFTQRVDNIVTVFSKALLTQPPIEPNESDLPLLIVGMPRSGTTLVEQILSSHPKISGGGELTYFSAVARKCFKDFPKDVTAISQTTMETICSGYLDTLKAKSDQSIRVTDKLPGNFVYLGLIRMLFPNARIIHCKRNPLDTCLSVFFQDFPTGNDYANDQADIAHYYRQYNRLMNHWNTVLPGEILQINYENVVADVECSARGMLEYLALPWDDACLDFTANQRAVSTLSRWQVRQPIYKGSAGRWRNYRQHIAVLIDALGESAD